MALQQKSDEIIQLIGFYVDRKLYGIDILTVREILRTPDIEQAEEAADFIKGFIRLRGESIPVIDMGFCLGQPEQMTFSDGKTWVLVCQAGEQTIGYCVEDVTQILRIPQDTILPPPELIVAGLRSPYIRGVCETDRGLLVVLNTQRILLNAEMAIIRRLNSA